MPTPPQYLHAQITCLMRSEVSAKGLVFNYLAGPIEMYARVYKGEERESFPVENQKNLLL